MKHLIKKLLREGLLGEDSGVDVILDKISREGISSLSDFEKNTLDSANTLDTMDVIMINWLDSKYSNLNVDKTTKQSFGRSLEVMQFFDDSMELVMEYEVKSSTLYISYEDISHYIGDHFDSETFQYWFDKNYNIKPKKISQFFSNVD